ncbi:hypothetical protein [Kitasatospora sp. NPDC017646]|uniref:hypothetical protein n=1 Tax=Kitasatospora sp. NPDC017646 TaxID=3364024 RepID=UPI0037A0DA23
MGQDDLVCEIEDAGGATGELEGDADGEVVVAVLVVDLPDGEDPLADEPGHGKPGRSSPTVVWTYSSMS